MSVVCRRNTEFGILKIRRLMYKTILDVIDMARIETRVAWQSFPADRFHKKVKTGRYRLYPAM